MFVITTPFSPLGFVVFILLLLALLAIYFRKRKWSTKKKKAFFSAVAAFLVFPMLVPAGTIAAIPAPNIIYLFLAFSSSSVSEHLRWYWNTIGFSLISYLITALVFWLVSYPVFFDQARKRLSDKDKE